MMTQPTIDKLQGMRMASMAQAWMEQQQDPKTTDLSFDERFGLLVDAEYTARENRALTRRMREAKLRFGSACLEDVETPAKRGLEKTRLRQLMSCEWVQAHLNIIITGPTGVGKSYLACALAQKACREGYRALYRRAPRLHDEFKLARAAGEYSKLLTRLSRVDVLVIDDWGIGQLTEQQRHDMLEIVEDRYAQRSTVITAQLPVGKWHDYIGDPTLADAVLDRLVHNAHRIELKGASRRKEEAKIN